MFFNAFSFSFVFFSIFSYFFVFFRIFACFLVFFSFSAFSSYEILAFLSILYRKMYAEERLEQLEQIIEQLVSSEDQYSPLKSLLDSLPTLLKVDEAIVNYRKKAKELREQLKLNKSQIKQCSENLNSYEVRAKSQLEAATQKRDKDNRTLATRLAAVQNSIVQMSIDNQLAVKSQEVHIKQESNTITQQVENQLKAQITELNSKLKNTGEDGKKFHSRLTEGASKIIEEIKSFEDVNKIRIETMQKQGRGNDITKINGKDNLRN